MNQPAPPCGLPCTLSFMVVSTEYYYRELSAYDEGAIFVVTQKPKLLLAEEEIFLDDHIVLDDPPVPPEVEIVPFFANGKEILIL